jgi:threonine synthase
MRIFCTRCSYDHPLSGFPYHCPVCGGILLIEPEAADLKAVDPEARGMEGYRSLLPVDASSELVSLTEGGTPLVRAPRLAEEAGVGEVLLKNETVNPTGSFKDRALSVMTTRARDEGFRRVVSSSSGNAGVASAAYAARAGLEAAVLVPGGTKRTKIEQILVHGARVVRVRGSTSDTYEMAKAIAEKGGWANLTTTFLSPLATAAFATMGYELVDQLEGRAPDWVIAPVSAGPILVAVAEAFRISYKFGRADGVPRMACAQAKGCAPIVRAFEEDAEAVVPWGDEPDTIATAISDPLRGYAEDGTLTLRTIRETHGHAVAVDDDAIRDAARRMASSEGVFAEPAGAVPVAALSALRGSGVIRAGERVVCLITGHGLKDPAAVGPGGDLPVVAPDPDRLLETLAVGA